MSRPVVYRVLPKPWTSLQEAEWALHEVEWALLKAEWTQGDCTCDDCRSAALDREQAAAMVRACAAQLHALWLPHEEEPAEEDRLLAEAMFAFLVGDDAGLDEALPEAGLRIVGQGVGLYMRFADSASSEEPELARVEMPSV